MYMETLTCTESWFPETDFNDIELELELVAVSSRHVVLYHNSKCVHTYIMYTDLLTGIHINCRLG
jgi:hypothetical protein